MVGFPLRSSLVIFLFHSCLTGTVATSVAAPVASVPVAAAESNEGGNMVTQLFGYVKDSVVRTVSGTKEMWSNHGRCKEIRAMQKDYRDKLKAQWELQEKNITPKEMKRRLDTVNGGISYDEYVFLAKGKEDRGRLMNLVFIMWGAPRLFPYALMFYPDMLPSPFAPLPDASGRETKLEKLSRQRSHAVIQTLLNIENEARSTPALAKLNIFGKKKQERAMTRLDEMGKTASLLMMAPKLSPDSSDTAVGARLVLEKLDGILYNYGFSRGEKRLVQVPKAITSGLMTGISGKGPLNGIMPNFMKRGNIVAHVQKVAEADNFLVHEKVDLDTLSTARLLEACNDRMIGGTGKSDDELRQELSDWLDLAVVEPRDRTGRTGEEFNENLARAALMGYYSVDATRDSRSSSYLPRSLFQGQLLLSDTEEAGRKKKR